MKKLSILVTLLLATTLLGGCSSPSAPTSSPSERSEDISSAASGSESSEAVKIVIWYEGNDSRLPYFQAVEAEMQTEYPNYSIEAVTFDNATLTTKALQAVTSTGGVDLIFNSASRLLELQQQSENGFQDLSSVLADAVNQDVVTDGDKMLSSSGGALVVFPINRSLAGLGVKTDIPGVDVTADNLPKTWDEFTALGQKYTSAGKAGFTMHLGVDPGQVYNLFMVGSGKSNVWLNSVPESQIATNMDVFKQVTNVYAGSNAFWDKDATSEDFAAMYSKIQSGSVGMFRVGDWNVTNWDKPDSGVGEFAVTTWPAIDSNSTGGLVNTNTRGMALPNNAPHANAAKAFLKYALSTPAQKKSFETMGSCIDLSVVDLNSLSPNQKIFFDPTVKIYPIDNYAGQISYYPDLLDTYEKGLTAALNAADEASAATSLDQLHAGITKTIADNQ